MKKEKKVKNQNKGEGRQKTETKNTRQKGDINTNYGKKFDMKEETKRARRKGDINTNYGQEKEMKEEKHDTTTQRRQRLPTDGGDISKLEHMKSGAGNQRSGENRHL